MGISIGLVGLGSFGSAFAELFMAHPLVERVGLCDREPGRVARLAEKESWRAKFGPRDSYESLEDICRSDLDALVVITQPWLHAPQCVRAMKSGKSVYSAVPVISIPDGDETLEWCDKLVRTVERTGKRYMLGETTYYRPQAMYCRRRAAEGDFGEFVYCEGEYIHPYNSLTCDLREVRANRLASSSGREWLERAAQYACRGVRSGPMHYPTHSVSGPMCVTSARPVKVCCWGFKPAGGEEFFAGNAFSNETALFVMSDGSTMRICEYRQLGGCERETFRVYGTEGCFEGDEWVTLDGRTPLSVDQMRDPLPSAVVEAWRGVSGTSDFYGGHGGSHAYLVHEFVSAVADDRPPAIDVYQACNYMSSGVTAHKSALRDGQILEVPTWGQ